MLTLSACRRNREGMQALRRSAQPAPRRDAQHLVWVCPGERSSQGVRTCGTREIRCRQDLEEEGVTIVSMSACRQNREGCKRSAGARSLPRAPWVCPACAPLWGGGALRAPDGYAPPACAGAASAPLYGAEGCSAAWRGYERAAHEKYAKASKATAKRSTAAKTRRR